MSSPTQRTREWLRKRGITSQIVERWNSHARVRQDLFGFADLLAIQTRIIAIQVTSGSSVSARVDKIFAEPRAREWLAAGGLIEVHGWRKLVVRTKDGKLGKAKRWALRRIAVECDGMGAMVAREIEALEAKGGDS